MSRFTTSDIDFIINHYPSEGSLFCSKQLNIPIKYIRAKISNLKLNLNDIGISKTNNQRTAQKHITLMNDFNPKFNSIQAYALGLLWADGYLYQPKKIRAKKLALEVVSEDFKDFKVPLESLGKIIISTRNRPNRKPQTCGLISNYGLCEWLSTMDYHTKSLDSPHKILTHLDTIYHRDFIRGWLDGDGCIYYNIQNKCCQISISGQYEQDWKLLSSYLQSLNISHNIRRLENKKHQKHSILMITGIKNVKSIINHVYHNNDLPKLERKFKKAQEILKYF